MEKARFKMEYTYKEWQRHKCKKLGHDWAIQDCDTYMQKVCLRCGATQVFFAEEVKDADMDDDNSNRERYRSRNMDVVILESSHRYQAVY